MYATQFFIEQVDFELVTTHGDHLRAKTGVSFRVGCQIGTRKWPTERLQIMLEDLTTPPDTLPGGWLKRRRAVGLDSDPHRSDEVCITVLGLDGNLTAEDLFSGICSLAPGADATSDRHGSDDSDTDMDSLVGDAPATVPEDVVAHDHPAEHVAKGTGAQIDDAPATVPEEGVPSAKPVARAAENPFGAGFQTDDAPVAMSEDVAQPAEPIAGENISTTASKTKSETVDTPTGADAQTDDAPAAIPGHVAQPAERIADTPALTKIIEHYRAQEAALKELQTQNERLSVHLQAETQQLQLRTAEVQTLEANIAANNVVREEMRQRLEVFVEMEHEVVGLRAEVARLKDECAEKDAVIADLESEERADLEALRSAIDVQLQRKRRRTE
ncbi:hypothetical protein C8R46DRAFT_1043465 [Mycena filopes]|nr:hypothetical protein C8R46DRAFT_1043465 [Mycena filopes]